MFVGSTSRQTMESCHSCSDTRGTSVFSWPPSTNTKRLSWNTVSSSGPATKRWAVPNTLADICGREVAIFHFVGGATLVEAFYAAYADFQEDMKLKRPDTLQHYNQVLATLNGGLTDVTLLDERTPPDVLDQFISAGNALRDVGAKSPFMERYLKTPIIEEKWHQKRKQEAEERRLQKKRRESTSKKEEAPDSHAHCQSQRSQSGYQTAYLEFIRTNFDEAFVKFDAFLAALNFHKMMVTRGLWEKYADMMRKDFRSTELQMQSTVVYHANKTIMDKLEQHCGELPDDQFAWVLFAALRLIVPTRDESSRLVRKPSDTSKFDNLFVTPRPCRPFDRAWHSRRRPRQWHPLVRRTPRARPRARPMLHQFLRACSCTCRLQRRSKDLGKQVRARGVPRHPFQIRRGIVGRGATSLVRAQLEGLQ